ncbi:MAG: DNA recombination protein RmuC [Candidatus Omnitrophota bacterium]
MIWAIIIGFIIGLGFVLYFLEKNSRRVNNQLTLMISEVNKQLNSVTQQVNERIREVSSALSDTHRTVGERLDSATKVFGNVQASLGRLEETNKRIYEISKDISGLQSLLRAPKFRGELGETLLGNLLSQVLPKEHFLLQHRFRSGDTVDAAVAIGKFLIPIDAKFPLENFKKFQEADTDDEKKANWRIFIRDVKNRVEEVSKKYILPDEGTSDFAMMYIPAEAIYQEVSRDDEISSFCQNKKVISVSPNTFYAYLQVILHGLKGMNIERNVRNIIAQLERLRIDLNKFKEDFDLVGGHLTNASKKYNDARSRLEHFSEKLTSTFRAKEIEKKDAVIDEYKSN